jgi:hypothetical protein
MRRVAEENRNKSIEQLQGYLAEVHHETTFNADAARKGLPVRAKRTDPYSAADLEIRDRRGLRSGHAQLKYHGSPARTAFAISLTKYDGMQKVVPSDQVSGVRALAWKRGADALGNRNYADTARTVSDRVRGGGAESDPLSLAGARALARRVRCRTRGKSARSDAGDGRWADLQQSGRDWSFGSRSRRPSDR